MCVCIDDITSCPLGGWRAQGAAAVKLDIAMGGQGSIYDLLSVRGLVYAVCVVRRLRRGGCLFGGVPCSSWASHLNRLRGDCAIELELCANKNFVHGLV